MEVRRLEHKDFFRKAKSCNITNTYDINILTDLIVSSVKEYICWKNPSSLEVLLLV